MVGLLAIVIAGLLWQRSGSSGRSDQAITIGVLRWVDNEDHNRNVEAFQAALAQAGYDDTKVQYVMPDPSGADADTHRASAQAILNEGVDLIYSLTTPGTLIVKEAAPPDLPIVFSIVTYPVETGVIDSLQGSGNNLVGTRNWVPAEEQLSVFLELVPRTQSIGFVHRLNEPNSTIQLEAMRAAAAARDVAVVEIAPATRAELPGTLASAPEVDAFYGACDTLVQAEAGELDIIAVAQQRAIPAFSCNFSGVQQGAVIGTVADFSEIGRLAGEKAVLILNGISPSTLETNTVARPFIFVNKTAADQLGLVIPQALQARVQETLN